LKLVTIRDSMNYIDIILLILLFLSAINGFRKGFVEELAGLVALLLGIWAALHFSGLVAQLLAENFGFQNRYLHGVSFLITFIIVLILVNIIGAFISNLVKAIHLGFLNQLAGLVFGVIKGALVLSVFLVLFNKLDEDVHLLSRDAKAGSRLFVPIKNFAPSVFPFLDFWNELNQDDTGKRLY
jgi:membrane protein required for colicin V production